MAPVLSNGMGATSVDGIGFAMTGVVTVGFVSALLIVLVGCGCCGKKKTGGEDAAKHGNGKEPKSQLEQQRSEKSGSKKDALGTPEQEIPIAESALKSGTGPSRPAGTAKSPSALLEPKKTSPKTLAQAKRASALAAGPPTPIQPSPVSKGIDGKGIGSAGKGAKDQVDMLKMSVISKNRDIKIEPKTHAPKSSDALEFVATDHPAYQSLAALDDVFGDGSTSAGEGEGDKSLSVMVTPPGAAPRKKSSRKRASVKKSKKKPRSRKKS